MKIDKLFIRLSARGTNQAPSIALLFTRAPYLLYLLIKGQRIERFGNHAKDLQPLIFCHFTLSYFSCE